MVAPRAPILKFKLLNVDARLPKYAHEDDAGFDLYSTETVTLKPGQRHTFQLGLMSEIPQGWFVSIRDKSGLASNSGLHTMAGVVDSSYRSEWGVVLINHGDRDYTVEKDDKIAQGILQPASQAEIVEVQELSETTRGSGGFGSTGRR